MRLALLYTRLSGYMAACLREFRKQAGAELLIFARPAQTNAPFDFKIFSGLGEIFDRSTAGQNEIEARIRAFQPDAVLVSGWVDTAYNRICRKLKAAGVPVIAGCDTQWKGSLRQRMAALAAPWHVRRFIDVLWVTGERQRKFAQALGFRGARCWDGYYACDWGAFAGNAEKLPGEVERQALHGPEKAEKRKTESGKQKSETLPGEASLLEYGTHSTGQSHFTGQGKTVEQQSSKGTKSGGQPHFLFVGRYVPEKGLDVLAGAYRRYRTLVGDAEMLKTEKLKPRSAGQNFSILECQGVSLSAFTPWSLVCAGKGEMDSLLKAAGVEDCGFVPPEHLPQLMQEASCFVLPSRFEPWGVVVQEAAASGLPLIVSDACGAGDHLVRDGFNGFVIETGNVQHLATAMLRMHQLSEVERREFGRRSFELSKQYTPLRWANTLKDGIEKLKP